MITGAEQLLADLREALALPPARDEWNVFHQAGLRDHLRALIPAMLAQLEQHRQDPGADQARIETLMEELSNEIH